MGVNSLPKTVTRQRRGCDLNPDPTAPESSTLATRLCSDNISKITHRQLSDTIRVGIIGKIVTGDLRLLIKF